MFEIDGYILLRKQEDMRWKQKIPKVEKTRANKKTTTTTMDFFKYSV